MKVITNSDNFLIIKIIFNMWIILIIFLILLSIYLTIKIKFDNYKINIKELLKKDKTSLFLTLGTKIGVGSIIGTTSSIIIGGFGSVLWIIIFSILGTSIIYYEAYLGNKYKKEYNNEYVGGPHFILKYGLNKNKLAIFSLILLIIIYSFLFQIIQMNTISNTILNTTQISKSTIFIVSLIILIITTKLSIKEVLNIMNKIVPVMCILFMSISMYAIIKNFEQLINSYQIFKYNIFSLKSILCGLVIGVKRSIFMNEILIGTTSVSSSSDKNDIKISIKYQILSVIFISIIITLLISCLLLIYLSDNKIINDYNILINNVYNYTLGNIGNFFLLITFILFGLTTMLSGYYIGKNNIEYITQNKIVSNLFKISFIVITISGIFLSNTYIWKYIDILIFIMIIINSYSIIKLLGSDKDDR